MLHTFITIITNNKVMKNKTLKAFAIVCTISFIACSLNTKEVDSSQNDKKTKVKQTEPHRYGGWYCPDNLNGFPAVNIADWQTVPVVNGRLSVKADRDNGATLIVVDTEKYPNAKSLDITMPKLAKYYNEYSQREDLIIVIQAINISNDSIVGYRFLNGGNGSARLKDIQFLTNDEIKKIPSTRFITHSIDIRANQTLISKVLENTEFTNKLQPIFDTNKSLTTGWRQVKNVNYNYPNGGLLSSSYAHILFGNFYVQNDYEHLNYTEKFLLLEDKNSDITTLQIVCGPFADDYDTQKMILDKWSEKVKILSEK